MIIRAAVARDIDAILALQEQHAGHVLGSRNLVEAWVSYPAVVAEADGKVVGFAASSMVSTDMGLVEGLVVAPGFREQGIGTRLLQALEVELEMLVDAVVIYDVCAAPTPPGSGWLERRGYTLSGMTQRTRWYWKNLFVRD